MMKKNSRLIVSIVIAVFAVVSIAGTIYCFQSFDAFRAQFIAGNPPIMGEITPESRANLAARNEVVGLVSFGIFVGLIVLQFAALLASQIIIGRINVADISVEMKNKQLKNADIFFDLPLYIGLFGTVTSFMVMTFSPGSLLIAYSSTLVGILFSIVLRLVLLYPMKSKLLTQSIK